ncbi:hypothetical protein FRC03_000313 [Tulasnella sp. 419]|nr:hypothetical protein FRC03_000313 [Tulasnella sp. 419]
MHHTACQNIGKWLCILASSLSLPKTTIWIWHRNQTRAHTLDVFLSEVTVQSMTSFPPVEISTDIISSGRPQGLLWCNCGINWALHSQEWRAAVSKYRSYLVGLPLPSSASIAPPRCIAHNFGFLQGASLLILHSDAFVRKWTN